MPETDAQGGLPSWVPAEQDESPWGAWGSLCRGVSECLAPRLRLCLISRLCVLVALPDRSQSSAHVCASVCQTQPTAPASAPEMPAVSTHSHPCPTQLPEPCPPRCAVSPALKFCVCCQLLWHLIPVSLLEQFRGIVESFFCTPRANSPSFSLVWEGGVWITHNGAQDLTPGSCRL